MPTITTDISFPNVDLIIKVKRRKEIYSVDDILNCGDGHVRPTNHDNDALVADYYLYEAAPKKAAA